MGFFTDLKEDLSQAVNELIPEEEGGKPETARSVMETARELVPAEDEFASEEEIWAEKENWADESWADASSDEDMTIKEDMTEKLNSMLENLDENEAPEEMAFGSAVEQTETLSAAKGMAWADLKETAPEVAVETVAVSAAVTAETVAVPEPGMAETAAASLTGDIGVGSEMGAAADIPAAPVPAQEAPAAEPVAETGPVMTEETVTETNTNTNILAEEAMAMEESMVEMTAAETAAAEEMTAVEPMETVEEAEAEAVTEEAAAEEEAAEPERVISDEVAVVTAGMKIVGDMTSDGSMDVVGTVQGNIDIWGKLNISGTIVGNSKAMEVYAENARITGEITSEGSVKIGQSSVIIGNIYANSAVVAGAVKGDIDVQGPVILDTTAIVMGNIKSKSVQINNGAVIEGMCSLCYADVNPTSFFEAFK